jgi:hypothetical protein
MVHKSTTAKHNYGCPASGDDLKQDNSVRGCVAHVSNPRCEFENGEKDHFGASSVAHKAIRPALPDHEPTRGVRMCGYSERGIFNALLYEIGFSSDPIHALSGLLSLICVPGMPLDFSGLEGAEVLVEQSLSDFGDADVILLLHGAGWHRVVFVEGKVKPSQVGSWTARNAWKDFQARKKGCLDSSNLFTQLYHKVRFISALRDGGIAALQQGVVFPACSKKTQRKLGRNPVVVRATRMIEAYAQEAIYVAVVPDSVGNLGDFFANELVAGPVTDVTGWSTAGWGFLTWEQVEEYCRQHGLERTMRVFDFNRGQIY